MLQALRNYAGYFLAIFDLCFFPVFLFTVFVFDIMFAPAVKLQYSQ